MKEKISLLEDEKKQKLSKKDNLFADKEKFQKELEEKTAELEKLTGKLSEKELEMEGKKKKLILWFIINRTHVFY